MNQVLRRLRTGLAACTLLLVGNAAQAQYVYDDAVMPPRAVAWRLSDRGFTGIGRPVFDGRAYVVDAFAPNGERVRLFVDAQDGAILGRRRLDTLAMGVPPRAARAAPGYGWTDENDLPRRPYREAERLLPPADIPMPDGRAAPQRRAYDPETGPVRSDGSIGSPSRAAADPNTQGLNPDAGRRPEAPKRVARVGNPPKVPEAKARTVPEAPKPRPTEGATTDAKPDTRREAPVAAVEPPKAVPPLSATPAAVQPPQEAAKAAATKATETKPAASAWKEPPEGKRAVRVIGGATLVPGTADKEPAAQ